MENMSKNSLSERLTINRYRADFDLPAAERAYRRWIWSEVSNTFRPLLIFVSLANLSLIYADGVYVGYGLIFYALLAIRLLVAVILLRAYLGLRHRRHIAGLPALFIQGVFTVVLAMPVIIATRPGIFLIPMITHITLIFAIYMFIPFVVAEAAIILWLSALMAIFIYAFRGDLPLIQIFGITLPYLIVNVLGIVAAYRNNRTRRLEFAQSLAERRLSRQLLAAKRHAEQANQAKSNFMAFMSHEIRTPLTSMLGFAQLLGDGPLSSPQRAQLDIIMRAGTTLTRILNDMLDIARVEAGRTPIEASPFELISAIEELANLARPKAQAHGMEIAVTVTGAFDHVWVLGDGARLQQVISNLIENAIKYAGTGCIFIKVHTREPEASQNLVPIEIKVVDQGSGIPEHLHATIFDPFTQGRVSGVETGVGLGLYICRQLMQAMGGELSLIGKTKGAEFQLTLSLPQTKPSQKEADAVADPIAQPLRILVVDDSELNRLLLRSALERDGHFVSTAEDGRLGVEAVLAQRFDIVLMDMRMPVMDGVEAVGLIRSTPGPNTEGLVIFALTAKS
jgi:signal transduction histidine kinase